MLASIALFTHAFVRRNKAKLYIPLCKPEKKTLCNAFIIHIYISLSLSLFFFGLYIYIYIQNVTPWRARFVQVAPSLELEQMNIVF